MKIGGTISKREKVKIDKRIEKFEHVRVGDRIRYVKEIAMDQAVETTFRRYGLFAGSEAKKIRTRLFNAFRVTMTVEKVSRSPGRNAVTKIATVCGSTFRKRPGGKKLGYYFEIVNK